jgi:hypothetical protein
LAEDVAFTVPCLWAHPKLDSKAAEAMKPAGAARMSIWSGVPVLLYQIGVAGCAPGVPQELREWCVGTVECMWVETGMMQARSVADQLRARAPGVDSTNLGSLSPEHESKESTPVETSEK